MTNKLINEFEDYLTKFKVKSVHLDSDERGIKITCSFFTYKIILDLALIAALFIGFYLMQERRLFDIMMVSLFFTAFVIMFWVDLNSINIITIDLIDRRIQIISRNAIKRLISQYLLKRDTTLAFTEIASFSTRSNGTLDPGLKKYFVDLKLKEKPKRAIAYSRNEGEANTIANFLTGIIHK